jgi:cytochrome c oxidase cbb3-type subunit III
VSGRSGRIRIAIAPVARALPLDLRWGPLSGFLLLFLVAAGCRPDPMPAVDTISLHMDALDAGVPRLYAGPAPPDPEKMRLLELPIDNPWEGNRDAIGDGRRLYVRMNCVDCHGEGGGSIGPTLWDHSWIYGGRGIDIFESIYMGRPDGMPAYGGHLPPREIWMLVTYLQQLEPRGGMFNAGVR